MIFLLAMMSTSILLLGKSRKRLTALERHRDVDNGEIDGAVRWSSLFSKPRRDFEREGARTFPTPQWLGRIHRGSCKPRFQCCVDSNNNLFYVRAIQGHSEGDLIAPDLMNHVAIPLQMEGFFGSCSEAPSP